jgi:DNA-binding MarR family transcriptional regulator
VADEPDDQRDSLGGSAKHLYLASRTLMDAVLRDYDLGPTQWYALWQLVTVGPTRQRELGTLLRIERATLSGIVATLVRKGLVEQTADAADQRQRLVRITDAGRALWATLPNPAALANEIAFAGADPAEVEIARRILDRGTQRLLDHVSEQPPPPRT